MSRVSRTIFVRNLPYSCTNDKLEELFSAYGPVKQCFIVTDKNSGKSRGIGYVIYTLRDDAIKAKDEKVNIDGRRLLLDFADIAKKAKNKRNQNKDETKEEKEPESEEDDNTQGKSDKKGKSEHEKSDNLKYHKAKIVLLTGLGNKLTEERLNGCLQKLNVKHVAEAKLVSDGSAHVKFKCIRDAKRAVNRLHEHEYKGSKLTANQLSKDAANIPPKMLKRCRLIVRNLAFKCKEKDLERNFEKFGDLTEIKVAKNTVNLIQRILKIGHGPHKFGECDIILRAGRKESAIEPDDCVLVSNGYSKSVVDDKFTPLLTNGVAISMSKAEAISSKVLSLLQGLLYGRRIPEQQLIIRIFQGRNSSEYGHTNSTEIRLYLKQHKSDIHFLGTLIHELTHFFTFDEAESHGSQWQECSLQLMALINCYLADIPVEDSGCHQLCTRVIGANCCEHFVTGTVVIA